MKTSISLIAITVLFIALQSCVQEEHEKTVTFKVDMSQVENVKNVGIRGQFTAPSWEVTVPMSDDDQDGIYEVTLSQQTAQSQVQFKFVNQNDQFELAGKNNRHINFEYKPETIVYTAVFNDGNGSQQTVD